MGFLKNLTIKQVLPYIFMLAGAIGCLASFTLTYDKIHVLQDPSYSPTCNINPVLSCGTIMNTPQSNILGVPNSIFGLVAYSVLFAFGVILASGAKVKKWVWQAAQVAATIGVVFMHYLFFQGVYAINAICPWCFVVWIITIPIFWYTTLYNLREQNVKLPPSFSRVSEFAQKHHGDILIVWYLIIFAILLEHFWYYWSTLI